MILSGKLLTFDALTMQQLIFDFSKNENLKIDSLNEDYEFFCGGTKNGLEITVDELGDLSDYNLLDVRTYRERAEHNIEGQHIPLDELTKRHHEIPQNKDLVVYCKSGVRNKKAIDLLMDFDFPMQLLNLKF
jgi:adenylyltransferase/sulfurtransferase